MEGGSPCPNCGKPRRVTVEGFPLPLLRWRCYGCALETPWYKPDEVPQILVWRKFKKK